MECPYCGTRNLPGTIVCNNCGAILREIKRARPAPKERASSGGGIAGAARALFGGNRARSQAAAWQGRIQSVLEKLEETSQKAVQDGTATAQMRLDMGAAHLLQNQIERAVQEYQFAQKAGASGPEFANNAGVALARRGHLAQALDMFPRAAQAVGAGSAAGQAAPPQANLAHALSRLFNGVNGDVLEQGMLAARQASTLEPTSPTPHNRRGMILCLQQRYPEAAAAFGQALKLAGANGPAQADALNNLGVTHALSGDLSSAASQFGNALAQEASHARALTNQAVLMAEMGSFDDAVERLGRAAQIDPLSALVRNNHGFALSRMLAINEGIREFKEAINLDAQLMEPLYNQAKSYGDEGISDFAERYVMRALAVAPRSWQALTLLGVIKLNQGQGAQAVQSLRAARQLRPQEAMILTNLALALVQTNNEAIAESTFQEASRLAPQDYEINLHLGWLYLRQGQTSASTAELAIALDQNDSLAIGHNNYGLCEVEMANPQEALRRFRRALQIAPGLSPVYYQLGGTYALLGDMPAAIEAWERNAKEEPGNADCYCNLGVAYYKAGKFDKAMAEFRHVITIRQNRMDDFSNMGLTYAKQGMALKAAAKKNDDPRLKEAIEKHRLAIEMFDRALAILPSNVMLHSNRGLACYFANRPEDAMQEWGHVSRLDPGYARRRGQKQQTEFDETQVNFVALNPRERALSLPPKTPDYQAQYAFSYDLDDWELILSNPALAPLPQQLRQVRQLERTANLQ